MESYSVPSVSEAISIFPNKQIFLSKKEPFK